MNLNRDAMIIAADRLLDELEMRIAQKKEILAERDRTLGADRIRIGSYMENLGWPPLFGYDMNRFFRDPVFQLEQELRQRIFWLDNSIDDSNVGTEIQATAGMYFDFTLFGQRVTHASDGVPSFSPHPISDRHELRLLEPFVFDETGDMPLLLKNYCEMTRINESLYDGRLTIEFPRFMRGPLDIAVQLRGFENLMVDMIGNEAFVHDLLAHIVDERIRWNRERAACFGETMPAFTRIDDDWVNIPLISPAVFSNFVLPAYHRICREEAPVNGFHTCGRMEAVAKDLLAVFPDIRSLDISGWNNVVELNGIVPKDIYFRLNMKNTFVLTGSVEEHKSLLGTIRDVRRSRPVKICAQAIVRIHDTYDEDIGRMNAFIATAREYFHGT